MFKTNNSSVYDNPYFNVMLWLQRPPYANIAEKEYPSEYYENPYTQNFENFVISINKEHIHDLNPLLNESLWNIRFDEYFTPCLDIYSEGVTRSGKLNGIKILFDLETYDNGDTR